MNKNPEELKELVREKYSEIVNHSTAENKVSCCGSGECADIDYSIFSEDYSKLEGYAEEADLALGCGIPVKYAGISKGDVVVDLGSGAGNDAFVASALTGSEGKVIGIDMTEAMIERAKENARKLEIKNVSFRLGEIEDLPMANSRANVVLSNCVLNLVPDKAKAFEEVYRVLKPGGHFCISDVVIKGELPGGIKEAGEMYAGCVSGALQKNDYLNLIHDQGFEAVTVNTEKEIKIPDEILSEYLDKEQLEAFHASGTGIYSVTITANRPKCDPETGCC